jgi:hypothetical protein
MPEQSAHATDKLTFFDLPAELRNSIYEHYFNRNRTLNISTKPGRDPRPALLRACKQVATEATSMYWHDGSFLIIITNTTPERSADLVQYICSRASELETSPRVIVHIRYPYDKDYPDAVLPMHKWRPIFEQKLRIRLKSQLGAG